MNRFLIPIAVSLLVASLSAGAQPSGDKFMRGFTEEFNSDASKNFVMQGNTSRYLCGVPSFSEKNRSMMLFRINPDDPAGAGRGPEIETPKLTHFGSYSSRFKVPDVTKVQPKAGVVVGYFTYKFTKGYGLSEIDIEFLLADPRIIYVGVWTSDPQEGSKLQRVGRAINLATGEIISTDYRSFHDGYVNHQFDSSYEAANTPATISAIEGFDASKQFCTYGFDWYPDRVTWWMERPDTGEKMILWDYNGTTPNYSGIPQSPSIHMFNFWHTPEWSVYTVPESVEKPAYPYVLEIDWMKYEPFEKLSKEWRKSHNF